MWNVQIVWFLRVRSNKLLLCTTSRLLWTPGWQEIPNIATIPQLQEVICPILKDEHNDHRFREFVGRRQRYLSDWWEERGIEWDKGCSSKCGDRGNENKRKEYRIVQVY